MCICVPAVVNGYEYYPIIANIFRQCVYSPIELISFILGLGNIGFWLVAQFPQIIQTFLQGSVEALSPMFILQWLLGDICNLIGCIFTKQYPTQLYTALYYCFMDILMMAQYAYYVLFKPIWKARTRQQKKDVTDGADSENGFLTAENGGSNGYGTMYASMGVILALSLVVKLVESSSTGRSWMSAVFGGATTHVVSATSRKLLEATICDAAPEISEWQHILGIVAAWISGILYFTARLPQVWLNFKRKSVEGLSFPMFFCAVMGNTCYGLSVLLPGIPDWKRFMIEVFPYILGSLCTVLASFLILYQFFIYRWLPNWKKAARRVANRMPRTPDGVSAKLPFLSTSTLPGSPTPGEDMEDDEDVYYYTEDVQPGVPTVSP